MNLNIKFATTMALCAIAGIVHAADYRTEYAKKMSASQQVGVLGDGLAGDKVNFFTGGLEFSATDVSLPGNFNLPVSVGRRFVVEPDRDWATIAAGAGAPVLRAFGDWELDIPYLTGTFSKTNGWEIDSTTPTARCSVNSQTKVGGGPASGAPRTDVFLAKEFWNGNTLHLPGGDQTMLVAPATNTNRPSAGGPYHWTTNKHWWFSCLGATKNNAGGEAFLAQAPDGSKYYFDWLTSRPASAASKEIIGRTRLQLRKDVFLLPSRIVDRFGNTVDFAYSNDAFAKLLSITASDGRTIALTYNASGYVDTVSDGTRIWRYIYTSGVLTQVTLPDNSAWQFGLTNLSQSLWVDDACDPTGAPPYTCYGYPLMDGGPPTTGYIVHPSGARVDFTVAAHFQAGLANGASGGWSYPLGLTQKTISGPGIASATWRYANAPAMYTAKAACGAGACPIRVWTDELNPDGSMSRQLFDLDGLLLQQLRGAQTANSSSPAIPHSLRGSDVDIAAETSPLTGSVPVFYQEADTTYTANPTKVGFNPAGFYASTRQPENLTPEVKHVENLQGASFTRQVNADDPAFRIPTSVTSTGAGLIGPAGANTTYTKTILTTYQHDLARWIIGQVNTVSCTGGADCTPTKQISRTDFEANSLPWKTYSFGVLQQALGYNFATPGAYGALSTVTDGLGNVTALSDLVRGIPQHISYPTGVSQWASVDGNGSIVATSDELGSYTSYGYDTMGRLSAINYPTGDTTAWNALARGFVQVFGDEYGLLDGHWKQTVATGNGRTTTFYDARWNPVVTLTEDTAIANSVSVVLRRFDAMGREVFTSYPVDGLATISDALPGVTTRYDALGRAYRTEQDSELGPLVSNTTEYLPGFQTRSTNARGFQTTTSYQAFDSRDTSRPVLIQQPEGVTTTISRQSSLGKPLSVTRSGTYGGSAVSATRQYVYDPSERLCKTLNPESGAALVDYDAAGNVAWTADGTALTTPTCDRSSVTAAQKTTRSYDAMNRVTAVATPGGIANQTTTYYPDGAVNTLTAANAGGVNVTTTYRYNKRRLLTSETSANGSIVLDLAYGYDANGHLGTMTYPDNEVVYYAPDALGRATQVAVPNGQVYASGIGYYPNGAISGFTYGNGIVHSMTQNARRLPGRSRDMNGATAILDDTYVFDANGNVDWVTDALPAGPNNRSRDLGYDGLDRMVVADAPNQWGMATYAYDPLDNLRVADQGLRKYRYTFAAATNRLTTIKNATAATLFTFGYDAQGNSTAKTIGAGCASDVNAQCAGKPSQTLVFDSANRLSQVTGQQSYRYDGMGRRVQTTDAANLTSFWIYSMGGQVMYATEGQRNQNLSHIYLGNTLLATKRATWFTGATAIRYEHTDALGSPVAETDASGVVFKRNSYAPFGEAYAPTVIDGIGYTGHVMDRGTGLTYMQQRYYDPQIGRFLSTDPMPADPDTGANFNSYWYADNNPYRFTDPDGRKADEGHFGTVTVHRSGSSDTTPLREDQYYYSQANSGPLDPNAVPGGNGPYDPKPQGRPGEFQGPTGEKGVRSLRTWVPPDAKSGSKGYWKEKWSNEKGWRRMTSSGKPLTPEQAHPGNRGGSAQAFITTVAGRILLTTYIVTYSESLNEGEDQHVQDIRDEAGCTDKACP